MHYKNFKTHLSQHKKLKREKYSMTVQCSLNWKKNFIYTFLAEASLHAVLFFNSLESKINGKGFTYDQADQEQLKLWQMDWNVDWTEKGVSI